MSESNSRGTGVQARIKQPRKSTRSLSSPSMRSTGTRRARRNAGAGAIAKQGELAFRSWGGARRGAGLKPKGERALVPHDARPAHAARFPLLITTRLKPCLPSLRRAEEAELIRAAIASTNARAVARAAGLAAGRAGIRAAAEVAAMAGTGTDERGATRASGGSPFQVVHYSIQSNHLHLIVEAGNRRSVTAGMRGLLVRIARVLNRHWGRRGQVFADRFHERELRNPMQVRNALVYVLQNLRKHGIAMQGPDPFSSGPEFDGWRNPTAERIERSERKDQRARVSRPLSIALAGVGATGFPVAHALRRAARVESPSPRTWLLGVGWQRHGLIDLRECPRVR